MLLSIFSLLYRKFLPVFIQSMNCAEDEQVEGDGAVLTTACHVVAFRSCFTRPHPAFLFADDRQPHALFSVQIALC